jgi:uncharacterized protein YxjI
VPDYTIRKKLISIGRDYKIEDEKGNVVYQIDGKVRFARTFSVADPEGNLLFSIREKLLSIDALFLIKRNDQEIARVHRRSFRDEPDVKFDIAIAAGRPMKASGTFFREEGIRITHSEGVASFIRKKEYTAFQEIYSLYIESSENQSLMIAIAMCIAEMAPARSDDHT